VAAHVPLELTAEERLVSAVVKAVRHHVSLYRQIPDRADLREELRVHIRREILAARLEGLSVPMREREAEIRKALLEFAHLL
jgi:hypothetical protein